MVGLPKGWFGLVTREIEAAPFPAIAAECRLDAPSDTGPDAKNRVQEWSEPKEVK